MAQVTRLGLWGGPRPPYPTFLAKTAAPEPEVPESVDGGAGSGKYKPDEWTVVDRPVVYRPKVEVPEKETDELVVVQEPVQEQAAEAVERAPDLGGAILAAERRIEELAREYENQRRLNAQRTLKRKRRSAEKALMRQREALAQIQQQIEIIDQAYVEAVIRDEEEAIVALLMAI